MRIDNSLRAKASRGGATATFDGGGGVVHNLRLPLSRRLGSPVPVRGPDSNPARTGTQAIRSCHGLQLTNLECPQTQMTTAIPTATIASEETDKLGLLSRYRIGKRTLEEWLAAGLIHPKRRTRKLLFDVGECDRRLFSDLPNHVVRGKIGLKWEMANRYGKTIRTISKWMKMKKGLLVFFKVKNVVRFDIEACDASLREHTFIIPQSNLSKTGGPL